MIRTVFLVVFFASGTAALIYQVIWQRLLTFTTGADVHAVTIVVAAFMAGLGLGSLMGGALADRLGRRARLWTFAGCEIAIAVFALGSAWLFYDVVYLRVGPSSLSPMAAAGLSFLATLWPTVLMGMSLPLAARIVTVDAGQPARWVTVLYGWNTLGAALGAFAAVTIVFRTMDFERSLQLGAVLNLLCAAAALVWARQLPASTATPHVDGDTAQTEAPRQDAPIVSLLCLYALSGFVALSLEVVWFRILGVILKSTAMTFGYLLSIYLGGLALGSLLARSKWAASLPAVRSFLWMQAAIPLYAGGALGLFVLGVGEAPMTGPLFTYLGGYDGLTRGEMFSPLALAVYGVVPLLLIGPPTILMGLSFGSLQRAAQTDLQSLGRRVGWLQSANIGGAVVGAVLTGYVLLDALGSMGTLRVLILAAAAFIATDAVRRFRHGVRPRVWLWQAGIGIVVVGAAAWGVPPSAALWGRLHGVTGGDVIFAEDGTGLALLHRPVDDTKTVVFANGLGQSHLPYGGVHTVLGALPAFLHPRPERIAVIGLGSGDTTFAAAGREETTLVDSIEIVAPALDVLRTLEATRAYPALTILLTDPRVHHRLTDGRAYLLKRQARYDIIEADALRPNSAYAGNLYSAEYFALLRSRLEPGGFAVTWVPTPRVLTTLVSVFPHVLHVGQVAIGSERAIAFDPGEIRARLARPFSERYYAEGGIDIRAQLEPYLARPLRVFGPDDHRSSRTDLNRDLFPRDEFGASRR